MKNNKDNKAISIKADGTLDILVDKHLFEKVRKAHTWYTNSKLSIPAVFFFGTIDILGFMQIMDLTFKEDLQNKVIIIAALATAFEIAPLYIGYAICLKSYKLGRNIHNWVLLFSTMACILGIFGNTYFRFTTMNYAYTNKINNQVSETALPLTVLMCILPVITSLINLTLGLLVFDPLLFDLLRLSKKLEKLKLKRKQIESYIEEFNNEDELKRLLEEDENSCYESVKNEIYALRNKLKVYAVAKVSMVEK